MADINSSSAKIRTAGQDGAGAADDVREPDLDFELIELLFFAYRDFVSDPDTILAEYGFGRAHHRVLHFVNRNPGITVTELLDILKITKQSLGRVLKQLVESGFIEQQTGSFDRRQRLLFATTAGHDLAIRLAAPQSHRILAALEKLPAGSEAAARDFLLQLVNDTERAEVRRLTAKR
ncbi:DNA-binding MarR family transcriptional regulator [Rhodobium orientis]|uniref:MarR family transcriptional regulator n=1 Tax=Rhodobium orientis TaxID=34017 RepID=A0A327JUA1_9HYPH|nr:MarR family transcriptional regulator [Rhodobium orientis]MBB4301170.1 DNA-binding MarR family transcriptional regulator [Rhodobium orientis]MBK5949819.1 MarR family transcriptional regulator [Rhodobium orientis]RAI30059.1 MarR family transcriptional regulator [Rhodobium orientis]